MFLGSGKSDVDVEVKRLVLSYMNGIQAIYLLPSLQQEIDISIVRMEMWTNGDPYNSYQVWGKFAINAFYPTKEYYE